MGRSYRVAALRKAVALRGAVSSPLQASSRLPHTSGGSSGRLLSIEALFRSGRLRLTKFAVLPTELSHPRCERDSNPRPAKEENDIQPEQHILTDTAGPYRNPHLVSNFLSLLRFPFGKILSASSLKAPYFSRSGKQHSTICFPRRPSLFSQWQTPPPFAKGGRYSCLPPQVRTETLSRVCLAVNALPYSTSLGAVFRCFCKLYSYGSVRRTT